MRRGSINPPVRSATFVVVELVNGGARQMAPGARHKFDAARPPAFALPEIEYVHEMPRPRCRRVYNHVLTIEGTGRWLDLCARQKSARPRFTLRQAWRKPPLIGLIGLINAASAQGASWVMNTEATPPSDQPAMGVEGPAQNCSPRGGAPARPRPAGTMRSSGSCQPENGSKSRETFGCNRVNAWHPEPRPCARPASPRCFRGVKKDAVAVGVAALSKLCAGARIVSCRRIKAQCPMP